MEIFNDYNKTIKDWSKQLSPWHGLVYCLTICKRSAPLYYDFVERENWGDKEAIALSHELLASAIGGHETDSEVLENCLERLNTFIPDTDEFSEGGYALDAGIVHIYSTELLKEHNPQNVYYAAYYSYEIVDNQVSFTLMPNGGIVHSYFDREVEQHEFIQDEIGWQSLVREELAQLKEGDVYNAEAKILEWSKTPLLR